MTPSHRWEPWTPEEDAHLLRRRAEGAVYATIGAELRRSEGAAARRGKTLGAPSAWRAWDREELALAVRLRRLERKWSEIRDALVARGWSRRGISQIVRKVRPILPLDPPCANAWTGPEQRLAQRLRAEGRTWREVRAAMVAAGYPKRSMNAYQRQLLRLRHHLGYQPQES